MGLKNKRVLITAGPTWVPIDNVRVISNTASGATGILLAKKLSAQGAKVTLLLGPVPLGDVSLEGSVPCFAGHYKVIRFTFFDELKALMAAQIKRGYDAVIHSAAVPDYRPCSRAAGKIGSEKKSLRLDLCPTQKLIDRVKKRDPGVYLVGFKFEPPAINPARLIKEATELAGRSGADIVVANTEINGKYTAYIVKPSTNSGLTLSGASGLRHKREGLGAVEWVKDGRQSAPIANKKKLADRLCNILERTLN